MSFTVPVPPPRQPRRLNFFKCNQCRNDRQRCSPAERQWPGQRCDRCIHYNYECSAGVRLPRRRRNQASPPAPGSAEHPESQPSYAGTEMMAAVPTQTSEVQSQTARAVQHGRQDSGYSDDSFSAGQDATKVRKPILERVQPMTGPLTGGMTITCYGRFFTPSTQVMVGDAAAETRCGNDHMLTCILPASAAPGPASIKIRDFDHDDPDLAGQWRITFKYFMYCGPTQDFGHSSGSLDWPHWDVFRSYQDPSAAVSGASGAFGMGFRANLVHPLDDLATNQVSSAGVAGHGLAHTADPPPWSYLAERILSSDILESRFKSLHAMLLGARKQSRFLESIYQAHCTLLGDIGLETTEEVQSKLQESIRQLKDMRICIEDFMWLAAALRYCAKKGISDPTGAPTTDMLRILFYSFSQEYDVTRAGVPDLTEDDIQGVDEEYWAMDAAAEDAATAEDD